MRERGVLKSKNTILGQKNNINAKMKRKERKIDTLDALGDEINKILTTILTTNLLTCNLDMPGIRLRYADICLGYAQDMPEICLRYAQDMPKICLRCAQDMSKICKIYQASFDKISKTFMTD